MNWEVSVIKRIERVETESDLNPRIVFISEIEKNYDTITLHCISKSFLKDVKLCLHGSKSVCDIDLMTDIQLGESESVFKVHSGSNIMSACILSNNTRISNRQFVIDANAFERSNPSMANRSLNQIRKLIEGGAFSTSKIIEYLSTIYKHKAIKKVSSGSLTEKKEENELTEGDNTNLYLSYEEIQHEIAKLDKKEREKVYIEYKSVRLWDSIVSYLRENRREEEEAAIDEEETENIDKSRGRADRQKKKEKAPISKSNYDRLNHKTEKFINQYVDVLELKVNDPKTGKPNLIDLSMYLILIEMLLHLLGYQENIEPEAKGGERKQKHLLIIPFSESEYSWSDFVLRITGLFTRWCSQKSGFDYGEAEESKEKTVLYKLMAFKASLTALSLVPFANHDDLNERLKAWVITALLNIDKIFNDGQSVNVDLKDYKEYVPNETKEYVSEQLINEYLTTAISKIESTKVKRFSIDVNSIYLHPTDGYSFIFKIIPMSSNRNVKLLKLISPGYEWDEDFRNYWNGKVYNADENKWISSRRD